MWNPFYKEGFCYKSGFMGKTMSKKNTYAFLAINLIMESLIYSSLQRPMTSNIYLEGEKGNVFLLENERYFPMLSEKIAQAQEDVYLIPFLFKTYPTQRDWL
tara:strand:- start:117 stop:422 length:306 start_codon:yes stop_codon:yes gene_type:complete